MASDTAAQSARSRTEPDLSTIAGAIMTTTKVIPLSQRCHDCYEFGHEACGCGVAPATCARCGDPRSDHCNRDGQPLQGRRASRFTGYGFCNKQHLSGGIAGSLQWCGCLGFEER